MILITQSPKIVALRNEKGSYNVCNGACCAVQIVALRNEKGSYNICLAHIANNKIVALRNEKGSYNWDFVQCF